MAKKSNRPKPKTATRPPKPVVTENEQEQTVTPAAAENRAPKLPKVTRSQAAAERIEDEYAYIIRDLRRVFILAAAMFLLLIALNVALSAWG
jgi:hypothetical protein